jgi:hypothetical protein
MGRVGIHIEPTGSRIHFRYDKVTDITLKGESIINRLCIRNREEPGLGSSTLLSSEGQSVEGFLQLCVDPRIPRVLDAPEKAGRM